VAECMKQNAHLNLNLDFYFWRDSNGKEVDLLFKNGDEFNLIEIKASQTIKSEMFKNLDYVSNLIGETPTKKTLIYGGETNQKRTNYTVFAWKSISDFFGDGV
jgi:predicted AAA+ superfamily ATPase